MEVRKLPHDEWVHLAPERGSVRVNHESGHCSGESDSLIITRKDDGISAFCFRCGASGWFGTERRYRRIVPESSGVVQLDSGYSLPPDSTSIPADWPKHVRAWVAKAGLTTTAVETQGWFWSDSAQCLYIPVVQEGLSAFGPKAVGYVLRRFQPKSYLTLTNDKTAFWGLLRASEGHPEAGEGVVVLVEDVLSGLRCREICDSLVLLGTELRPAALAYLVNSSYKEAVIFLDGDNPTVKMKARKIAKTLSWLPTKIVETGNDPKSYSKDQLENLICTQ